MVDTLCISVQLSWNILHIIVTLFIYHNSNLLRRVIYWLCMPFLEMSCIYIKRKGILVIYEIIYELYYEILVMYFESFTNLLLSARGISTGIYKRFDTNFFKRRFRFLCNTCPLLSCWISTLYESSCVSKRYFNWYLQEIWY